MPPSPTRTAWDRVAAALLLAAAALAPARTGRRTDRVPARRSVGETSTAPGRRGRIDRWQMRHRATALPVAVVRKFGDDEGGKLAALIAYYGFFSLFPALLALVTVLGYVLQSHPDVADRIARSALAQFPVVGDDLRGGQRLTGSIIGLVVGLGGALWAGMGAAQAAQDGMNALWDVPRADGPSFLRKRARSLATLVLIGVMFAATSALPEVSGLVHGGAGSVVLLVAAALAVDAAVTIVAFRLLTIARVPWRALVPGACVAAVGYVALQAAGRLYVTHVVQGARSTYGTFGIVIGLLSWMYLLARWTLLAAEINVVRHRRLWPRSLFRPAVTEGDRASEAAQAAEARISDTEQVEVSYR